MTNTENGFLNTEHFMSQQELIVKVQQKAKLRSTHEGLTAAAGVNINQLTHLLGAENVTLKPLFGVSEERLNHEAETLAATTEEVPDLSVYYKVEAPHERLEQLAESLRQLEVVEAAYVTPADELAVATQAFVETLNEMMALSEEAPPATGDFTSRQGYLNAAPAGIDTSYAWTFAGGRGAGVGIVDIEGAWRFSHEDLIQNQGGVIAGSQSSSLSWRNHGTAVVGEFGGDRNSFGVTGICPDANVRAVSIFGGVGSAEAIRKAANASKPGDIILIELHRPGPRFNFQSRADQRGYIAMEWWPHNYDAIRYAVSRGVIVVEAAGNGAENLDDAIYDTPASGFPASWKNPFNPANPSSGAVIVGAGAPPPGTHGRDHGPDRSRLGFSNYGMRVDCQGWGREVTTTGYGDLQGGRDEDLWYTDRFSGTSSASPIVVGALGCVQGILRSQGGTLLTSEKARSLLRSTGSPQQDAPGRPKTQRIGNRPDLRELIAAVAKIWYYNKKVIMTYATSNSQNAWAYIDTVGWRKIKTGKADGVTNLFSAFCEAVANQKKVTVQADSQFIYIMYLV